MYPFEKPSFKMEINLESLRYKDSEGNSKYLHFDYYYSNNPFIYRDEVEGIPEFDVDFSSKPTNAVKSVRKKIYYTDENHKVVHDDFYPKVILQLKMTREPFPRILRTFIPMYVLAIIKMSAFNMKALGERMSVLSLCMLSYI